MPQSMRITIECNRSDAPALEGMPQAHGRLARTGELRRLVDTGGCPGGDCPAPDGASIRRPPRASPQRRCRDAPPSRCRRLRAKDARCRAEWSHARTRGRGRSAPHQTPRRDAADRALPVFMPPRGLFLLVSHHDLFSRVSMGYVQSVAYPFDAFFAVSAAIPRTPSRHATPCGRLPGKLLDGLCNRMI